MQPYRNGRDERSHRPSIKLVPIERMANFGAIKWFADDRHYGFITPDDGSHDVFLHQSTAHLYGIRKGALLPGVRVAFNVELVPGRGPLATAIAIA